jgi:hypothetical protein
MTIAIGGFAGFTTAARFRRCAGHCRVLFLKWQAKYQKLRAWVEENIDT